MIDKLEYFIALAKARHFGRAAEELGRDRRRQPATPRRKSLFRNGKRPFRQGRSLIDAVCGFVAMRNTNTDTAVAAFHGG